MNGETEGQLVDEHRFGELVGRDRLMVTAAEAAAMCGKKLRTWRSWDAAGFIPQPVRLGRTTLWRVAELKSWIEAGCPRRSEWEATR